jgi:hypothetical protein
MDWDAKEAKYFEILGILYWNEPVYIEGTDLLDPDGHIRLREERDALYEQLWGLMDENDEAATNI